MIVSLVDQLFDDSTSVVRDCGDIVLSLYKFFKNIIMNLSTGQGWTDLVSRVKSDYLTYILEIAQGSKFFRDQDYYKAGF